MTRSNNQKRHAMDNPTASGPHHCDNLVTKLHLVTPLSRQLSCLFRPLRLAGLVTKLHLVTPLSRQLSCLFRPLRLAGLVPSCTW